MVLKIPMGWVWLLAGVILLIAAAIQALVLFDDIRSPTLQRYAHGED